MTGLGSQEWADPGTYEHARQYAGRDWAWEFLRRNPGYIADWNLVAGGTGQAPPDIMTMTERFFALEAPAKWGLIFRRCP